MAEPAIEVRLGAWIDLRDEAAPIRYAVFVDEQKVPAEIELDDWDALSLHALALDAQGRVLGTGRLLPDGHIGRMAVLQSARGQGVGTALLRALLQAARAGRSRGRAQCADARHAVLREGRLHRRG